MENDQKRKQKARIGQVVARIAVDSGRRIPANQLSNWRNGWGLPRLEQFLEMCQEAGVTDLSLFLSDSKNIQETC